MQSIDQRASTSSAVFASSPQSPGADRFSMAAVFRAKKLDLGGFVNIKTIRDHTKRKVFEQFEPERYRAACPRIHCVLLALWCVAWSLSEHLEELVASGKNGIARVVMFSLSNLRPAAFRQALRYIIRNTSLPQRMRTQAQLQLAQMSCYTRPTQIKNRCTMGGVGKGVLRAFRMGRVSLLLKH